MTNDRYVRVVLTVIAAALVADVAKGWLAIPNAYAADTMRCEIVNPVRVEGKIDLGRLELPKIEIGSKVEVDTFSKPVRIEIEGPVDVKQVK